MLRGGVIFHRFKKLYYCCLMLSLWPFSPNFSRLKTATLIEGNKEVLLIRWRRINSIISLIILFWIMHPCWVCYPKVIFLTGLVVSEFFISRRPLLLVLKHTVQFCTCTFWVVDHFYGFFIESFKSNTAQSLPVK